MTLPKKINTDSKDTDKYCEGDRSRIIKHIGHLNTIEMLEIINRSMRYFSIETSFIEKPIRLSIL